MAEQTMWAVKVPNEFGYFDMSTASITRRDSIRLGEEQFRDVWAALYREGFRCIRVRVTEVQDGA